MTNTVVPFQFDRAIVRLPATSVIHGLRSDNGPNPDFEQVCIEHALYVSALEQTGVNVTVLPPLEAYPDGLFVEDPALVFSQGAIKLRPGSPSRRGEVDELDDVLHQHFDLVLQLEQGHVDGGDVLFTPHGLMIGLSERTNLAGAKALQRCLDQFALHSDIVETPKGVLHFKSDCSLLDVNRVISTRRLAETDFFKHFDTVIVPEGEEAAANALRVNNHVLIGQDYPHTIELLQQSGYHVIPLPTTEIAKIDAGLSCLSLRWKCT